MYVHNKNKILCICKIKKTNRMRILATAMKHLKCQESATLKSIVKSLLCERESKRYVSNVTGQAEQFRNHQTNLPNEKVANPPKAPLLDQSRQRGREGLRVVSWQICGIVFIPLGHIFGIHSWHQTFSPPLNPFKTPTQAHNPKTIPPAGRQAP